MKRQLITSFSAFVLLIAVTACSTPKETLDNSETQTTAEPEDTTPKEFTGEFRSVEGVMDELSCYVNNGGYVTLDDGSFVRVSFKDDAKVSQCKKIKVKGKFTIKEIDPDDGSPCPSGRMRYLIVDSYECLE